MMMNRGTPGRAKHDARKNRESLGKRLGRTALRIRERDGHRCAYCARDEAASGAKLQLDHLTPRSEGGADEPRNLVTACRRCNSARQAMTLRQFAAYALALGVRFEPRAIRAQASRRLPEVA